MAVWSVGEYGELLFVDVDDEVKPDATESDVVKLLESILYTPHSNLVTREFAINAVMKLSVRFKSSERYGGSCYGNSGRIVSLVTSRRS